MGKNRLLRWGLLIGALLLCAPVLASTALGNAGMLALRDGLLAQGDFTPSTYPFYAALVAGESTEHIAQTLRQAVALNPGSSSLRWALGRAALAVGDAKAVADALEPLVEKASHHPLLYSDALTAFSRGGRPEAATRLYELAPPPQQTRAISDTVALAYLEQGGRDALERAIALRPGDLYANYFLWKQAQEAGDVEATATYSETLVYFPLEAIDPTDERLLDYATEAIPNLLEDGLWGREKTLNVVSYLVWQHHEVPGVERLLEQLAARYPTEPDWPFYLAELYHRRGNLEQAEAVYRQVLTVAPEYAQAYLRLGMVSEEASERESEKASQREGEKTRKRISEKANERLSEAARWYEQYNALAPDDLLGLKHLSETCTALEQAGVEDGSCLAAAERVPPVAALRGAWLEQAATVKPEYLVGQELDNGWTFLGYDVDEDGLIRGEPMGLVLYWKGPDAAKAGSERDGWYQTGKRWVQVLEEIQNLVLNGGFELGTEGRSPTGFPYDIYRADSVTRRLVTVSRTGKRTTAALLNNTDVYSRTSFASMYVPVNQDGLYMQAGWIKSVGGNGYLGRRWAGDIAENVCPYSYVVTGVSVDNWQHYAGLTRPLEGASRCQIWELNYKSVGRVYFDNILFVEIGLPGE